MRVLCLVHRYTASKKAHHSYDFYSSVAHPGAESASGLPQGVVAVDDQAIHAVVSGLDQVRMISGKGIRRFHTTGLAQFQRRAKDCATPGAPFIFIQVFPVCWKNLNENKLISYLLSAI